MSATSRRRFLSGAGTLAAAAMLPSPRAGGLAAAMVDVAGPIDLKVAASFCEDDKKFLDIDPDIPYSGVLLYGLVFADRKFGRELLLPQTRSIPAGPGGHPPAVPVHRPRLWAPPGSVASGGEGVEVLPDGTRLPYWDTAGYSVTLTPLPMSAIAEDTPTAKDHSKRHPWAHKKWVRDVVKVSGKRLLAVANRSDETKIAMRMGLKGGSIVPTPPFTAIGATTEWAVRRADGMTVVHATTDSMLWTRQWPKTTTQLKVTFTPIGVRPAKTAAVLNLTNKGIALAVTHATTVGAASHTDLVDTRAFALLLDGGDPLTYPFGVAARGVQGDTRSSASDGHCESGSN